MTAAYRDILYLPRPLSGRRPMAVAHRAKQFAPFAALKGFEDEVRKQEIIYEDRKEISEEKAYELDMKLKMLEPGMEIRVVWFSDSRKRPGKGFFRTSEGKIDFFDPQMYLRIGDTEIQIPDIMELSGTVFEEHYISAEGRRSTPMSGSRKETAFGCGRFTKQI